MEHSGCLEANKAVVRKFLESMPSRDLASIGECLADDVIQHYQRPTIQNDDGSQTASFLKGREAILDEIRTYFYQLYRPGTIRVTIETLIAERDLVAAQFVLAAITARRGEPYENFYHFLYRCRGGKVVEYWEYVDTRYAQAMLFT
ncbi:MAG TPA: nuclear transport factor 2 family protein [Alphaproteobacteria bacterium]|nr:nuclear transport factor 2 family protein [Alphaproteobacteria bacterium]